MLYDYLLAHLRSDPDGEPSALEHLLMYLQGDRGFQYMRSAKIKK